MSGVINRRALLTILLFVFAAPAFAEGKIIYVDDDANGLNDGSSWEDAYKYLQDALADANSSTKPVGIQVAYGIYRPDEDTLHPNGTGDRTATFQLINGVALKGGYDGFSKPDPNVSDIDVYETILSGDIGRPEYKEDNCYHIFYHPRGLNLDTSAILDGFIITGGNANSGIISWPHNTGGGMFNYSSSPAVTNCTFISNSAHDGGGMYNGNYSRPNVTNCTFTKNLANSGAGMDNSYSSPNVSNCKFYANSAYHSGGGMCNSGKSGPIVNNCSFTANSSEYHGGGIANYGSIPTFINCTFSGNSAVYHGGGMNNGASSPNVNNCTFSENSARFGGGISNDESSPYVNNCTFSRNSSGWWGGGMWNDTSNPYVNNCTFSKNSAAWGGGIYNFSSNPYVTNCMFTENSGKGGGIFNYDYSNPTVNNCTITDNSAQAMACDSYLQSRPSFVTILNCIIWNGPNWLWNNDNSTVRNYYSDVQGGWPGEGNINVDPCFADPCNGDYHLKSQAGRWETSENPKLAEGSWVKDDVTSLCIDAGDPASPIGLEPFPNGGIINMGAYGGTTEASKSYFGKPPCETIVAGDINGDCIIDMRDFAIMALHWLEEN